MAAMGSQTPHQTLSRSDLHLTDPQTVLQRFPAALAASAVTNGGGARSRAK